MIQISKIKKNIDVEVLAKEGDIVIYCSQVEEPRFGRHTNFSTILVTRVKITYDKDKLDIVYKGIDIFNITHDEENYIIKSIYPWQITEVISKEDINKLNDYILANELDDKEQ